MKVALRQALVCVTVAVLLCAALAFASLGSRDFFTFSSLTERLAVASASGFAPALYCAAFLVGTSLFVPAVMFFALAGVVFGPVRGVALAYLAANVTANAHFFFGRLFGTRAFNAFLTSKVGAVFTHERLPTGALDVVTLRQVPAPFMAVNGALGATALPASAFVIGNAIGLIPNCVLYTVLASQFVAGNTDGLAARSLAISAVVVLVAFALKRWLKGSLPTSQT
jgi:uncharacterized membrane protein YdjX (TVP38/TMEM64 family)